MKNILILLILIIFCGCFSDKIVEKTKNIENIGESIKFNYNFNDIEDKFNAQVFSVLKDNENKVKEKPCKVIIGKYNLETNSIDVYFEKIFSDYKFVTLKLPSGVLDIFAFDIENKLLMSSLGNYFEKNEGYRISLTNKIVILEDNNLDF